MADTLSLWRSPLDKVAIREAHSLRDRQPQCTTLPYDTDMHLMTIYNYGDYVTDATMNDPNVALDNMFTDMNPNYLTNYGGLAFIPQQSYPVKADVATNPHTVPDQCNIVGSGTGGYKGGSGATSFYHFVITPIGGTSGSVFLTCTGNHTNGGKYFRGLAFKWASGGYVSDICISAGTWNARAIDCTFTDCPTAFSASGVGSGMSGCTIDYQSGPDNAVAVYLIGAESFVVGPGEYLQNQVGSGGPMGCTAIALGGASGTGNLVHGVISNIHLADWSYAINYHINAGVNDSHITAVIAQSYITCVNMQPPSGTANYIFGEKYTSCTFKKSGDSSDSSAIVFVDTFGESNDSIHDIEFLDCTVYNQATVQLSGLYCYKITTGSNIRIIGGTASNAGPGVGTAGIAITPTSSSGGPSGPGRITILGVDLSATYPHITGGGGGPQQYALFISASLQDNVTVDDCTMTGYTSSSPVHITGTVNGKLYIRNCEGYNDQNTTIASGTGTGHVPLTDTSASTAGSLTGGTNYYGPSLVIFTNNNSTLTFTINGLTPGWTVPANAFVTYYVASPYDTIKFQHTVAAFMWIGK